MAVNALADEMRGEKLPAEFIETIETGWWTTCLEVLPAILEVVRHEAAFLQMGKGGCGKRDAIWHSAFLAVQPLHPVFAREPDRQQRQAELKQPRARIAFGNGSGHSRGGSGRAVTVAFRPEWFRSPLHRAVFRAIKALVGRGARDLDVGMVIAELQSQGTFNEFTGAYTSVCVLTEGSVPPPSRQSRMFRLEEMRKAWLALDQAKQGVEQ